MTETEQYNISLKEAQALIKEKDAIELKISEYEQVLRSQNVEMKTPLVDKDGFPRADLDIYTIRHARAALVRNLRLIENCTMI